MPTALLSVYDKSGIAELATALHEFGWRLVSSGGTAKAVAAAGVPVTDVAVVGQTVLASDGDGVVHAIDLGAPPR